jgi:hypothetical protein
MDIRRKMYIHKTRTTTRLFLGWFEDPDCSVPKYKMRVHTAQVCANKKFYARILDRIMEEREVISHIRGYDWVKSEVVEKVLDEYVLNAQAHRYEPVCDLNDDEIYLVAVFILYDDFDISEDMVGELVDCVS